MKEVIKFLGVVLLICAASYQAFSKGEKSGKMKGCRAVMVDLLHDAGVPTIDPISLDNFCAKRTQE